MIICNKHQSTRNLHWQAANCCFVAEASELTVFKTIRNFDGQVYDDACDVGFILVSHITGDSVLFVQEGVDMSDGDIAGWRYKAEKFCGPNGKWTHLPARLQNLTALIIND